MSEQSTDREPTVVVVAYNRPASLARAFRSLAEASRHVEQCPALIVSIDAGGNQRGACLDVTRSFKWAGEKQVIERGTHLGLRGHLLACGDLTQDCESILIIEDDNCLSPTALRFSATAVREYRDNPQIAGVSLYSFVFNEFASTPFVPVDDGFDTYFAQTAASWGQIWTRTQWSGFRDWLAAADSKDRIAVPDVMRNWPIATSWKRAFNLYLAQTRRYFAFPRFSFSTNMGEPGTHLGRAYTHLTSPLSVRRDRMAFGSLELSSSRYDAFLEIEPGALQALVPWLRDFDFDVDLTGTKPLAALQKPYVLTARASPEVPVRSFGFNHFPAELNIILGESGDVFGLRRRANLNPQPNEAAASRARGFFSCPS